MPHNMWPVVVYHLLVRIKFEEQRDAYGSSSYAHQLLDTEFIEMWSINVDNRKANGPHLAVPSVICQGRSRDSFANSFVTIPSQEFETLPIRTAHHPTTNFSSTTNSRRP